MEEYLEKIFHIKGIFRKEINDRFSIITEACEANNLVEEDFKNSNFGLHYCSLTLNDKEKATALYNMIEQYSEYFHSVKKQGLKIIIILPEGDEKYVDLIENGKIKVPEKMTIKETIDFIDAIDNRFIEVFDVNFGNVYITFKHKERRLENKKEKIQRYAQEDKSYVLKYKDISRQLADMDRLKKYM